MLDAVRAETFNDARTLFLFGSYTIGKERLFLEVARQLGKKARGGLPHRACDGSMQHVLRVTNRVSVHTWWPVAAYSGYRCTAVLIGSSAMLRTLGRHAEPAATDADASAPAILQVYMSAAKRKVMACLDLRPEYASLLTTDDRATNIQAVPLWMCSQKVKTQTSRCSSSGCCQPKGPGHCQPASSTCASVAEAGSVVAVVSHRPVPTPTSLVRLSARDAGDGAHRKALPVALHHRGRVRADGLVARAEPRQGQHRQAPPEGHPHHLPGRLSTMHRSHGAAIFACKSCPC